MKEIILIYATMGIIFLIIKIIHKIWHFFTDTQTTLIVDIDKTICKRTRCWNGETISECMYPKLPENFWEYKPLKLDNKKSRWEEEW